MQAKTRLTILIAILTVLATAVMPASAAVNAVSDEFNGTSLAAHWSTTDPLIDNPAPDPFTVAGGKLSIALPSGTQRTLSTSNQDAPRILQAVDDPKNFSITMKVDGLPINVGSRASVGIVVKGEYDQQRLNEDYPAYFRASIDTSGTDPSRLVGTGLFIWENLNGWQSVGFAANTGFQIPPTALTSIWLRLTRTTETIPPDDDGFTAQSTWRFFWSKDGTTWDGNVLGGEFPPNPGNNLTKPNFNVTHVGVWAGTTTENPAYTAVIDNFIWNDTSPVSVELTKTVDRASRPAPGGPFTFTLGIKNTSTMPVTITALTDDNPLSAQCTALIDTSLAAGASTSCTYNVTHTAMGVYTNTAQVTVQNSQGISANASATRSVTVTAPVGTVAVGLAKVATPTTLVEPGGPFTFTLTISNLSTVPVTITALTDDNELPEECTDLINTGLAASETKSCSYTVTYTDVGTYTNTASVTVRDSADRTASQTASATVTVTGEEFSVYLPFLVRVGP